MKIYVDELPKNCGECPFNYDGVGCEVFASKTREDSDELRRCLNSMYGNLFESAITDRRFSKCPLQTTQSLKQQVREEVVEEIKKISDFIFARYENRELDDVAYGELVCCNILIKKFQRNEGNEQC